MLDKPVLAVHAQAARKLFVSNTHRSNHRTGSRLCCVEITHWSPGAARPEPRDRSAKYSIRGPATCPSSSNQHLLAGIANFGEFLRPNRWGEIRIGRGSFIGFVAGKAKHQALVARAAVSTPHGDGPAIAASTVHISSARLGHRSRIGRHHSRPRESYRAPTRRNQCGAVVVISPAHHGKAVVTSAFRQATRPFRVRSSIIHLIQQSRILVGNLIGVALGHQRVPKVNEEQILYSLTQNRTLLSGVALPKYNVWGVFPYTVRFRHRLFLGLGRMSVQRVPSRTQPHLSKVASQALRSNALNPNALESS